MNYVIAVFGVFASLLLAGAVEKVAGLLPACVVLVVGMAETASYVDLRRANARLEAERDDLTTRLGWALDRSRKLAGDVARLTAERDALALRVSESAWTSLSLAGETVQAAAPEVRL